MTRPASLFVTRANSGSARRSADDRTPVSFVAAPWSCPPAATCGPAGNVLVQELLGHGLAGDLLQFRFGLLSKPLQRAATGDSAFCQAECILKDYLFIIQCIRARGSGGPVELVMRKPCR
jgi:hypothetical protein